MDDTGCDGIDGLSIEEGETEVTDPAIFEIPVFLSISENIYLFQHPSKSPNQDVLQNVAEGKIKPSCGILELTSALETDSEFYDEEVAENLSYSDPKSKSRKKLDTFTLRGDRNICREELNDYVMSTVTDGKMFVTPLSECLRFQPCFEYLDEPSSRKSDGKNKDDERNQSEEEEVPLTVKFAQKTYNVSERTIRIEEVTKQIADIEQEPWCEIKYHHSGSAPVNNVFREVISVPEKHEKTVWNLSENHYMKSLLLGTIKKQEDYQKIKTEIKEELVEVDGPNPSTSKIKKEGKRKPKMMRELLA